jgi:hypothetical protein
MIGRVPFGRFRNGHRRVHWNLRLGGKRLPRGVYRVTPRALTSEGRVRDLGRTRTIRIRG